jgi:hypothetical protein
LFFGIPGFLRNGFVGDACVLGAAWLWVLAYFPWVCVVENLAIGYLYDTMLGWIYAVEFPDCVCALGHT